MKYNSVFLNKQAKNIRKKVFSLAVKAKSGHIGSAFSCIDILTVLYFMILSIDPKKPHDQNRPCTASQNDL